MVKDVIVVRHPEFGRLAHQLAIATERFNQAANETQEFVALIGSLQTIATEDRVAFLDQIEAEEGAYDAIRELHDKILRLLREENRARAATNQR